MTNGYEVKTTVQNDGAILQQLIYNSDNVRKVISTKIMHTCDEQIKSALIKLGWTPPENSFQHKG